MKVSELGGVMLDYWVADIEGMLRMIKAPPEVKLGVWSPSTKWAHGGPIIEREKIDIIYNGAEWVAGFNSHIESSGEEMTFIEWIEMDRQHIGPTPLIAAMRAFVASRRGEVVPDVK